MMSNTFWWETKQDDIPCSGQSSHFNIDTFLSWLKWSFFLLLFVVQRNRFSLEPNHPLERKEMTRPAVPEKRQEGASCTVQHRLDLKSIDYWCYICTVLCAFFLPAHVHDFLIISFRWNREVRVDYGTGWFARHGSKDAYGMEIGCFFHRWGLRTSSVLCWTKFGVASWSKTPLYNVVGPHNRKSSE